MALLSDLLSRTRLEIGDQPSQFSFTATGDGVTKDFNLNHKPVDPLTLVVTVNGNPSGNPSGYTLEQDVGVIHFITAPALGVPITAKGVAFRYFTDTDITNFINTAVEQHTYNRSDSFGSRVTITTIPPVEEYPVAILAAIEALWILATDASFDINITSPDGVSIPRSQRYTQLTDIIRQRFEQYKMLCAQLNIGLWRIEMGTLIRTSRTTNKLVPIYMAQEIDDSRRPERVWIHNDLTGRMTPPAYNSIQDIILGQGDSYGPLEFDFPFDITGLTFKAQIRTYPNAPSIYGTFTIATLQTNTGKITLSLSATDTAYMPTRAFWDLQATNADGSFVHTYVSGQVFTIQQVTQ